MQISEVEETYTADTDHDESNQNEHMSAERLTKRIDLSHMNEYESKDVSVELSKLISKKARSWYLISPNQEGNYKALTLATSLMRQDRRGLDGSFRPTMLSLDGQTNFPTNKLMM
jgi:hypothetical protein